MKVYTKTTNCSGGEEDNLAKRVVCLAALYIHHLTKLLTCDENSRPVIDKAQDNDQEIDDRPGILTTKPVR